MSTPSIILASASIGRKMLLEKLGIPFTVMPSSVDEDAILDTDLKKMLRLRARAKAEDVVKKLAVDSAQSAESSKGTSHLQTANRQLPTGNYLIIAADSMAILDGQVFGKSQDKDHARRIVHSLNGRTHEFVTATHIIHLSPHPKSLKLPKTPTITDTWHDLSISRVTTRKMSQMEIDSYAKRYDFTRFAAAYTLNETPWDWITKVEGSYTGVIGLPFEVVLPIFRKLSIL